jgi:PhnB protein
MTANATTLIPHLCCRNAAEAIDFYRKAFGADVLSHSRMPNGKTAHAALSIGGALIYLNDEYPEHGGLSPLALNGTPLYLYLYVPDADAAFNRAVEAGCRADTPPQNMFWGDRWSVVTDPYGHKWEIATRVRSVSAVELQQTLDNLTACGQAEPAAAAMAV